MKMYKTKIGKVFNFIRNEGKFKRSDLVEVIKNNSEYSCYDKYVGQYAMVTNINYDKKEAIVELKFLDGSNLGFDIDELRKCDYLERAGYKAYTKLLKMI